MGTALLQILGVGAVAFAVIVMLQRAFACVREHLVAEEIQASLPPDERHRFALKDRCKTDTPFCLLQVEPMASTELVAWLRQTDRVFEGNTPQTHWVWLSTSGNSVERVLRPMREAMPELKLRGAEFSGGNQNADQLLDSLRDLKPNDGMDVAEGQADTPDPDLDSETGCLMARASYTFIRRFLAHWRPTRRPACLLLVQYGTPEGNTDPDAIANMGRLLDAELRLDDFPLRIGAHDFAVMLRANRSQAERTMHRLSTLAANLWRFGVAEFPRDGFTARQLLDAADSDIPDRTRSRND